MKKIIIILLTLIMIFTVVGCNSEKNTTIVEEPQQQNLALEQEDVEPIVGGYVDVEDGTITDELKDIFYKALEGLTGASYEPKELIATQVVAGINYKFLANGTKTTNPITKGTYYIFIYKDLKDNVVLKDIEVIEEKQEEAKTQDITKMKFWVVFYDQYDNELQREALKYGTIPEFKGWLPEGFDKWVYKKSGKDVGTFKSIKGNTYFKAVCHNVEHYSSGGGGSNPTPGPTCSNTDDLYYFTYLHYDWASYQSNFLRYRYNGSGFNTGISYEAETISPIGNIEEEVWYHSSNQYEFVECTDPNHHAPYGLICPHSSTYLIHAKDLNCNVDVYQWNPTSNSYEFVDSRTIEWDEFDPSFFSEIWVHTNNVDHPGQGSQAECIAHDAHSISS